MRLLLETKAARPRPLQARVEVVDAEEEQQAVARLRALAARQRRMVVLAPLVEAEQDRAVVVEDLAEESCTGAVSRCPKSRWYHAQLRATSSTAMMVHVRFTTSPGTLTSFGQRCPARPALRGTGLSVTAPTRRARSIGASARRASLIDSASGKTSITSGSIATMFAPPRYRAAVAPRAPSEKSYSARIVSRSPTSAPLLDRFFIGPPLPRCRRPRRNESGARRSFGVSHHKETFPARHPEDQISLLAQRVIRIELQDRERIPEYSAGFVECDTVLPHVLLCFSWVPFEEVCHRTTPRSRCDPSATIKRREWPQRACEAGTARSRPTFEADPSAGAIGGARFMYSVLSRTCFFRPLTAAAGTARRDSPTDPRSRSAPRPAPARSRPSGTARPPHAAARPPTPGPRPRGGSG